MKNPSAPQKITWIIGIIAGLLGIIGRFAQVDILTEYHFALVLIGFIVLAVGTTFKGMWYSPSNLPAKVKAVKVQ